MGKVYFYNSFVSSSMKLFVMAYIALSMSSSMKLVVLLWLILPFKVLQVWNCLCCNGLFCSLKFKYETACNGLFCPLKFKQWIKLGVMLSMAVNFVWKKSWVTSDELGYRSSSRKYWNSSLTYEDCLMGFKMIETKAQTIHTDEL